MNFQQLRIIRETVRQDFNLTTVANTLFTSQPGVSKHIKDLEDELGIEIFVRRGKRLLGLTEPGKELLTVVERILLDTQNARSIADHFSNKDAGSLVIATTHTQARYALPEVIKSFRDEYPKVHLALHQGSPREIAELLTAGEADIAIATEWLANVPEVVTFPYYTWHHAVIVPKGHPLESLDKITLADLAEYPIVTYHEGFTGRANIDRRFAEAGLAPDIVLSAIDADVIKTYVGIGLGVGIVAAMAFDRERDGHLTLIEQPDLFVPNTTRLALRRGVYLRRYAYALIAKLVPGLTEERIGELLRQPASGGEDFSI
ncbi:CysB family HTH-type transcriptional regulator [Propionivibrio dicarboxylicus]|uniref:LysR family transcriptional regulator, cys regulon transcriptional activator n=1 Tax=Propionivibrio dicarboxylicus TaxID=83767 RepID=A0A1G8HZX2_9RHOO|nr:CysB family HTH-type transcriptional regulator [Propionivibrio dicarboxylicus]SDI12154.1 LysR family transcriptional regulator, cys regulon transcriptional activator [Propionivibrio dicarboxylicus]